MVEARLAAASAPFNCPGGPVMCESRNLPADACRLEDAFCPADGNASLFRIVRGFEHPIVERYKRFLEANGIHIAGIEFILDRRGDLYTYDVNTNTNYNPEAEAEAEIYGMRAVAVYLGRELEQVTGAVVRRRRAAG
ncbi:MAG: hypothetical protein ACE5LL_06240 [Alphaproteobacteria bacterium]